ncbi:MAG: SMI1/KNR4 family protein [Planctomycetales bacterium]|nr:SMI1/KNR4 family protein [Planctomycetales bacterium]
MENDSYELACRCKAAVITWGQTPSAPLLSTQLEESRNLIDDSLPDLLVDLYFAVGNGGFGPQGGLLGLRGGFVGLDSQMTIDEMYREFMWDTPEEEGWDWPAELLPIAEGGCGLVYCIDLDSADAEIHLLDPNGFEAGDDVSNYVRSLDTTLYRWLDEWSRTRPPLRQVASTARRSLFRRLFNRP